jgi:Fe2+ or Zn2+ uptake regulation protein
MRGIARWFERIASTRGAAGRLCEQHGVDLRRKRAMILDAVFEGDGVFDFDVLWMRAQRQEPRISRAAVYSALRGFSKAGILRERGPGPRSSL